jgi:hypothetical protein
MNTDKLLDSLAAGVGGPVRPLADPLSRLALWLCVSLPWIAIVVAVMGVRPDLWERLGEPRWVIEQAAAALTGLAAAMAAFCSIVPGRPAWERAIPLAPGATWLSAIGLGCVRDWLSGEPLRTVLHADWACVPGIVMVGFGPGLAMAVMLHRGAPLSPRLSVGLGGLAAAALADFGLRLFHPIDAGLMVLVWQVGTVIFLAAICSSAGNWVLRWRHAPGR